MRNLVPYVKSLKGFTVIKSLVFDSFQPIKDKNITIWCTESLQLMAVGKGATTDLSYVRGNRYISQVLQSAKKILRYCLYVIAQIYILQ